MTSSILHPQSSILRSESSILPSDSPILVKRLGRVEYAPTLQAMQQFTTDRNDDTADELWLLEHPPVYTLGLAGKDEHLPRVDNGVPVVRIDRGGQITYHGPGQVVVYLLLDMKRRGLSVRPLVRLMERPSSTCSPTMASMRFIVPMRPVCMSITRKSPRSACAFAAAAAIMGWH